MSHPNILFILVDEQRYPPPYEDDAIRAYRLSQLRAQESIRARGIELHRHYASSVACVPSRASLMTGHYPRLHGVRATDGAAKNVRDADVYWLDPNTVPTIGDYFRAGGYRTFYKGKWHVSHADMLTADSFQPLASNDTEGKIDDNNARLYEAAARLEGFGFTGWVGPDPHGVAQSNTGYLRDPITAEQVVRLLDDLDEGDDDTPWLTVASFLNPHDITLVGLMWRRFGYETSDDTVPDIARPPTAREDLSTKPACQADFVDKYNDVFIAQPTSAEYRRFYYYLHKLVDQQIQRVLDRLASSRFADNTIIVFTSDHGEMLGAHGGLHQKWHCMYEEAWRVPLLFAGPGIPEGASSSTLSSHVDLAPTLLSLAGIDVDAAREMLARDHTEAQALVGRDLSAVVRGGALDDAPIYFMTEDEVSEGLYETNAFGQSYVPVVEPAKLEGVIARLEPGGPLYKFARYYDTSLISGGEQGEGLEDYELYNLDEDPLEQNNLAENKFRNRALLQELSELLATMREHKAVTASNTDISQ